MSMVDGNFSFLASANSATAEDIYRTTRAYLRSTNPARCANPARWMHFDEVYCPAERNHSLWTNTYAPPIHHDPKGALTMNTTMNTPPTLKFNGMTAEDHEDAARDLRAKAKEQKACRKAEAKRAAKARKHRQVAIEALLRVASDPGKGFASVEAAKAILEYGGCAA